MVFEIGRRGRRFRSSSNPALGREEAVVCGGRDRRHSVPEHVQSRSGEGRREGCGIVDLGQGAKGPSGSGRGGDIASLRKAETVVHVFSSREITDLGTPGAGLKKHSSRISQSF